MITLTRPKVWAGDVKYRYRQTFGGSTSYMAVHKWNLRNWAKRGDCELCGVIRRTEWSNKSGEYRRGDDFDWQEVCLSCHKAYDAQVLGVIFGRKRVDKCITSVPQ